MDQSILSSRAVLGMYYARLEANPGLAWVNGVSNLFNSDQASETYPFLGQSPAMREWVGGRQAKGLSANSLIITNRHYESTLEIALRDMRRDKTGQIEARVNEFADRSLTHWASLLSTLILNGTSTVCYDGQYYFDTDHVDKGGQYQTNQSNKSAVSLTLDNFEAAWVAATNFLDDQGEIAGNVPNLLIVPPAYKREAAQIADNREAYDVANRAINPWSGEVRYIVSPYLDSTSWFLVAGNEAVKPLMLVMREMPNLQSAWFDPAKPEGGHYYFKFFARYYVAYSDWRVAYQGNT